MKKPIYECSNCVERSSENGGRSTRRKIGGNHVQNRWCRICGCKEQLYFPPWNNPRQSYKNNGNLHILRVPGEQTRYPRLGIPQRRVEQLNILWARQGTRSPRKSREKWEIKSAEAVYKVRQRDLKK